MDLPKPETSRAVLVGVDHYQHLDDLPAVARNLTTFASLLTDTDLWGLPEQNCTVLQNPTTPNAVLDAIHEAAVGASDTLLVYFAGHGLLDPRTSDLHLALPDSDLNHLYRALRYDDVRREVIDTARCGSKVVLLDCCYSGQAMLGHMGGSTVMADHAKIEGTYLMTASAETKLALAPPGEEFTAFTGEIVRAVSNGLPDGPDVLDLETLYWHIRRELEAKGYPIPQQRVRNDGRMITLARNRRGRSVATGRQHQPTVVVPAGYESTVRRRPADLLDEVATLRRGGPQDLADSVVAAAVAIRSPQEAAAILDMVDSRSDVGADAAFTAVAQRLPADLAAVIDVLEAVGCDATSRRLLATVAAQPAERVASAALAIDHSPRLQRTLVEAAFAACSTSQAMIGLVSALWSVGLHGHVDELLQRTATTLSPAETITFADALRAAGRDEAAGRLYVQTANVLVTQRSAGDLALVIASMTEAGQDDHAHRVLSAALVHSTSAAAVVTLLVALSANNLNDHAHRALDEAVTRLPDTEIPQLVGALVDTGRDEQAQRVCLAAARARTGTVALALIDTLRQAGRPMDAYLLLDTVAREHPVDQVLAVAAHLSRQDRDRDIRRLMGVLLQRPDDDLHALVSGSDRFTGEAFWNMLIEQVCAAAPHQAASFLDVLQSRRHPAFVPVVHAYFTQCGTEQVLSLVEALRLQPGSPQVDELFQVAVVTLDSPAIGQLLVHAGKSGHTHVRKLILEHAVRQTISGLAAILASIRHIGNGQELQSVILELAKLPVEHVAAALVALRRAPDPTYADLVIECAATRLSIRSVAQLARQLAQGDNPGDAETLVATATAARDSLEARFLRKELALLGVSVRTPAAGQQPVIERVPQPLLKFDDHPQAGGTISAARSKPPSQPARAGGALTGSQPSHIGPRPPGAYPGPAEPSGTFPSPLLPGIPATLAERFVARLIDSAILLGALAVLNCLSKAVEPTTSAGNYVIALSSLALLYGYEFVMTARYGQTLGKYFMKIQVITTAGETPSWAASAARAYVPAIASCLSCGLGGSLFYLSPVFDSGQWKRGWHDHIAATVVVRDQRHTGQ